MRVISKFHDYYDQVMSEGQDRTLIYARNMVQFDRDALSKLPEPLKKFVELADASLPRAFNVHSSPTRTHSATDVYFGLVLFAGKLYPFADVRRRLRGSLSAESSHYVYDQATLVGILKEHGVDALDRNRGSRYSFDYSIADVVTFFALDGSERLQEHATIHNLTALSFIRNPTVLTIDPRLKDIQFYRRMPPFQAFQNISMWLGNIARPDRIPVFIEDKYRIPQHGFDAQSLMSV